MGTPHHRAGRKQRASGINALSKRFPKRRVRPGVPPPEPARRQPGRQQKALFSPQFQNDRVIANDEIADLRTRTAVAEVQPLFRTGKQIVSHRLLQRDSVKRQMDNLAPVLIAHRYGAPQRDKPFASTLLENGTEKIRSIPFDGNDSFGIFQLSERSIENT